jgi:alcohol dehydrogenase class IV
MALAGLLGGMALANAGLGAVHGFAAAIGGSFRAPHGAVCARLLPHVMAANIRTLKRRSPENEALRRYDEVARILTGDVQSRAGEGVEWARGLVQEQGIPPLSAYGVTNDDLPSLVEKAAAASSMKGNPVALTSDEMRALLEQAL